MSHLSAERLAALADPGELLATHEAEHLAACSLCARERDAYHALVAGARAERHAIGAPLTRWEGIAAGLKAEESPRRLVLSRVAQVAAGILLLAGGVAAGRASAFIGPLSVDQGTTVVAPNSRPATPYAFSSIADAEAALASHEVGYQQAAAYIAANDTAAWLDAPDDYRTRLVALERAGRTMREAMETAPYDPVLTGYYLTTLGQREATLRQLNDAVPASARLNTF